MSRAARLSLMLGGLLMLAATANAGTAAFLFTYRVSDTTKFDAAYRKHLEWHRSHQDHLSWYAWYVISGPRTGMFVDGTFGSDFAAFDGRPDPKGDGRGAPFDREPPQRMDPLARGEHRFQP